MSKQKERNPPKERSCAELCLSTYLPFDKIGAILNDKIADGQVYQAFYILHDKDTNEQGIPVEPHTHIYVRLSRSRLPSQICNWFRGLDEKGQVVNTFSEPVHSSVQDVRLYFTHRNRPDKYQYPDSDIHDLGDALTVNEGVDDTYNIFCDLVAGLSIPDLVRKYGRDFVYHYSHWKALMTDFDYEKREKDTQAKWQKANKEMFGLEEVSIDEIRNQFEID